MGSRRLVPGRLALFFGLAAASLLAQPPQYVTGDECLFCHRVKPADTWEQNAHSRTIRLIGEETGYPAGTTHILGARTHFRGLKNNGYAKFDLLSLDRKTWDSAKFNQTCAGCHMSDGAGLDCYTCHGVANPDHPKDISLMWLSTKHAKPARQMLSICTQCHIRGSKQIPAGFVVGDDLFAKFQPGPMDDAHIATNVREVLENGSEVTCVSCHQVHGTSTQKHRRVLTGPLCLDCHNATGPKSVVKHREVHSALCEY